MSTSAWKDFLPRNTLVMAKPRARQKKPTAPELTFLGEGPPQAKLVFFTAEPSSLQASELLHKMIEAMGLKKSDVFIAHFTDAATTGALTFAAIQPQIFVALGEAVSQNLLQTQSPIADLRGVFRPFKGVKLLATFHPEDLIKKSELKKSVWADLQNVAKEMGITIPARK